MFAPTRTDLRAASIGSNDRISIYKHTGKAFIRLGRFSKNPTHAKPGRPFYPEDQGCIGQAWSEGESFETGLPKQLEPYRAKNKSKWKIPEDVVDRMLMKSRSLAGFALERQVSGSRFAVVMFESVDPQGVQRGRFKHFGSIERQELVKWLETMERFEPRPADAEREGY